MSRHTSLAVRWHLALTGRWAVSLPAWLIFSFFGVLLPVISYAGYGSSLPRVLAVGTASVLAAGAVLWAASLTFLRDRRTSPVPWQWSVGVYVLASLARSAVLIVGLQLPVALGSGRAGAYDCLAYALTWFPLALAVSALGLSEMSGLRIAESRLAVRLSELEDAQGSQGHLLLTEREKLLDAVNARLEPLLDGVRERVAALDVHSADEDLIKRAQELQESCRTQVRALSHEVYSGRIASQETSEAAPVRPVIEQAFSSGRTWAGVLLAVNVFCLLTWRILNASLLAGIALAVLMLLWAALARLGHLLLLEHATRPLSVAQACWRVLLPYVVSAAVCVLAFDWASRQVPELQDFPSVSGRLLTMAVLVVPAQWALLSFTAGSISQLRLRTAQLEEANCRADSLLATLSGERERIRRQLASVLHGPVQGRLSGAALALAAAVRPRGSLGREQLLSQALAQLDLARADIEGLRHTDLDLAARTPPLDEGLSLACEPFVGLVDVNVGVDAGARTLLEGHGSLRAAVLDAWAECLINALRHGHARKVRASVELDERELRLRVLDDGRMSDRGRDGLGAMIVAASGGTRTLTTLPSGTQAVVSWAFETDQLEQGSARRPEVAQKTRA